MTDLIKRIRPNILALEAGLLTVSILCILSGVTELYALAGVCAGGLVGFGKEIISKEE